MEREQNRLPRGNSLWKPVEEELLKYINEQEFLSPENQSLSLSCSHGFKRQHCMWVVSTINHGPHHKNKCCTSAGDGQQRDITMVIEKAIMNKIDTFFKELDQRITVERGSFEFLFWFFVSYPSWLVIFSLALLCKQISWAALDVDRCFEQLSQMAA